MKWTALFMLCAALSLAQLVGCGDEESASPWVTVTVLAEPQVKAELEHVQVLRADTSVTFWLRNPPQGRESSSFPLSFDLRGEGAGQIDIVGYAEGAERIRRTLALPRLPKGRSFLTVMLRDDCLGSRVQCTSGFSCGGCEPEARCVPIDVSDQLGRRPTVAEMCAGEGSDGGPGFDGGDADGDGGPEDAPDGAHGGGDSAVGAPDAAMDGAMDGEGGDGSTSGPSSSTSALRPLAAGRCAGIELPRPEGDSASTPWSVRIEGRPGTLASDPGCASALSEVSFGAGSSSLALYFRPDPLPAGQYMGESKLVLSRGGAQSEIALEVRRAALALDTGSSWACALLDDATLQCWGKALGGQLAHEYTFSPGPLRARSLPAGISASTRLFATAFTAYALTGGKLSAWGGNDGGGLGIGSVFYASHVPYAPSGMQSGVTQVAGGWDHVCAVKDGAMYCWGSNAYGSVGGEAFPTTTPRKVSELDPAVVEEGAAGWHFSCARLSDGAVKCWGAAGAGQLGNGSKDDMTQPTDVMLPGPASRIWAGGRKGCALVGEDLYCWGDELFQPVLVDAPKPVDDMMLLEHSMCVQSGGDLYCRGNNMQGALGTGATSPQLSNFQRVLLPPKVEQLAHHAAMAICDGVVYGWGFDEGPTLGLSPLSGPVLSPTPTRLFDGLDVDSVTFGWEFGCARKRSDGQVLCWGWDRFGALGQGDTQLPNTIVGQPKPVVALPAGADALDSYGNHVFAWRDGQAYGWGKNLYGQLGRGILDYGASATPAPVTVLPAGAKVARVAAGDAHACALVRDSDEHDGVYCWGAYDTLGDGTKATRFYAADAGVTDLSSAGNFACAVVKGGVECWGGVADSMTPVPVTGLEPDSGKGVVSVEVGDTYACARSSGNAVWCWTRALAATSFPIQASALAVGSYTACAIDLAGELWCWNGPAWDHGNALGQLGQGDTAVRYVPTKVASLKAPVTHVSIMQDTVLARDAEGYKCWGDQSRRSCLLTPWIVSTPAPVTGWDVN